MLHYALVSPEGEVLETRRYEEEPEGLDVAAHKPRLLPVVDDRPDYDTETEVREGPVWSIENGAAVRRWTVSPRPVEERRAAMLQAVRDRRWTAETGGVTVAGAPIRTDEKSQAKLAGAVALFDLDPEMDSLEWEAQPGVFVTLTEAQIKGIGVAVGAHVQACFARSKVLTLAIQAAEDHADLDAIDIAADWPG